MSDDYDARLSGLLAGQDESVIEGVKQSLARHEAARIVRALQSAGVEAPDIRNLDDFLSEPDPERIFRIDQIMLMEADVLLVAQKKIGKSTLVANFIRALVDDEPFLGRFAVTPVPQDRTVMLFDNELGETNLRRFLREQQIQDTRRVRVADMRGKLASFNILDDSVRSEWADKIRAVACEVIVFDCLRPALDALGMSEDKEASRFAQALTALKIESGAKDLLLVHHAGHDGSRARGDSALAAWCTDEWKMRLSNQSDPFSRRSFSAFGRSNGLQATDLEYDPLSRRLSLAMSAVSEVRTAGHVEIVQTVVGLMSGLTSSQLHDALHQRGVTNKTQRTEAIREAQQTGLIVRKQDGRSAHFYSPSEAGVMWGSGFPGDDPDQIGFGDPDQRPGPSAEVA